MLVSIITVTYNSASTIQKCLMSIKEQNYRNYEVIIVDGMSTDTTVAEALKVGIDNLKIIQEPDDGIYDAMNKGLRHASGDVIHFLNSDDFYNDSDVLDDVTSSFSDGAVVVLGDVNYLGTKFDWKCSSPNYLKIKLGWHPPHPGFFCLKDLYISKGGFNTTYPISADFDIMLKIIISNMKQVKVLKRVTTVMNPFGESSSLKNIIVGNKDVVKSARSNGIKTWWWVYLSLRLIPKIRRKLNL